MLPRASVGGATPRVLVVGDVMLDVLVEVQAPFAHASDTPSRIATAPGGSAANIAAWLARAGALAAILAAVGEDPMGRASLDALLGAGVDTSRVVRAARPKGTVLALVEPDGQRSMLTDRGANLSLSASDVEAALAGPVKIDHVHVSGYTFLDDASRDVGLTALERAAGIGATRSVDASSAGPLRAVGAARFAAWVRGVELLFCNLDEATLLTGCPDARSAASALATVAGEAVVTDGPRGASVAARSEAFDVDAAVEAERATDTTGAGDAFCGTYLARRLAGDAPVTAATAATAIASASVLATGARAWERGYSRE